MQKDATTSGHSGKTGAVPTTLTIPALPAGMWAHNIAYDDDGLSDADLAAVLTVTSRIEQAVLGAPDTTESEIVEMVAGPEVRREESLLVRDARSEPVAACWYAVDEASRQVFCETYVVPTTEQEPLLLQTLVRHGLAVARRAIADRAGWTIHGGCLAQETQYADVLRANGFRPIRHFWRMEISCDSPEIPPTAPQPGTGVTIETGGSDDHRRAIHLVDQESFADHWNFTPRTYDELWRHLLNETGARPEYWNLLRVDGDPAAICLLNDSRLEHGFGYVSVLGVRRAYRRRGFGHLLLRRAFVQAREGGLRGVALHVDSESLTGATRLYESVGMAPVQVIDAYELAEPASPAGGRREVSPSGCPRIPAAGSVVRPAGANGSA